jgi:hypothetical protein
MTRLRQFVALSASSFLIAACSPSKGGAPEWSDLEDQVAFVGSQFTLHLTASDPEGDRLTFSFESSIADLDQRAEIRPMGESAAEFVWTPRANDEGLQSIDFIVSDGSSSARETVAIDVKASEGSGAPVFRKPLGTGSTLDLDAKECLEFDILIQDDDSTQVSLAMADPQIEGAELEQQGPFEGHWRWCPTPDQVAAQQNYLLTLTADDEENPYTLKRYAIYLYRQPRNDCPGSAPVITHTPASVTSVQSLVIDAHITDDIGLKEAPVVHWSTTNPGSPPDLGAMQVAPMLDFEGGDWAAEVPNPVASMPAGTTGTVYYVIAATDRDDTVQDCNHVTFSPASGVHQMTVTAGGTGSSELCKACDADAQCGDTDDNCVQIGGVFSCGRSCAVDTDCPDDYKCSLSAMTSVNGVAARQCIPRDFSCAGEQTTCQDDSYEDNDTRTLASSKPALPPGSYNLVSCNIGTQDDEDWFKITLAQESRVTIDLDSATSDDLDLQLVSSSGSSLAHSSGVGPDEHIDTCVAAGTAFIHVLAIGTAHRNPYTLSYTATAGCGAVCTADTNEPDDGSTNANVILETALNGTGYTTAGTICPQNEDWYSVHIGAGKTLYATLEFDQTGSGTDLDFNFYRGTTDLFPCNEEDFSSCDDMYGSGSTSNETFEYTAAQAGDYYLVVRGFDGAKNSYNLCASYERADCTLAP